MDTRSAIRVDAVLGRAAARIATATDARGVDEVLQREAVAAADLDVARVVRPSPVGPGAPARVDDLGALVAGDPALAGVPGLVIPLAGVGAALAAGRRDRAVDDEDAGILQALVAIAGLGLALANEREVARASSERLSGLVAAGIALAGETSLDDVLRRILETARHLLRARYAAIGVLDGDGPRLARFVWSGLDDETARRIGTLPSGRGLLGALLQPDSPPVRRERISDDPRSVGFPPGHPSMQSFLGVQIALPGEVFGNLYLTDKEGGAFTADDEAMAVTLAAQAAVAIGSARRYGSERQRVRELETLHEVGQAVLSTLDLETLLPMIADRARELTRARAVGVALDGRGALEFRMHGATGQLVSVTVPPGEDVGGVLGRALDAHSVVVAPLELAEEQVGLLAAVGDRPFDDDSRRLLATFAGQAGVAVANARAVASERRRLVAQERERHAAEGLRRAISAQEAERTRIARELHDEGGQVLTAIALHLRALEDHIANEAGRRQLATLRTEVTAASRGLRRLATELRPSGLADHGLANAIERQAERVSETSGLDVDVAIDVVDDDLPDETQIALFRVVQEALTNVVRHSRSRRASVSATRHAGVLRIVVEDEGEGFDVAERGAGLGLAGMRERVELIGGRVRIESERGRGTTVIVEVEVAGQ